MSWLPLALSALRLWEAFFVWANTTKIAAGAKAEVSYAAMVKQAEDENAILDAVNGLRSHIVGGVLPDNLYRD